MTRLPLRATQRGATLVVALIMLALITLLVVNAFTLSSSNLKAVGNMQIRDEAVAAANKAVEQIISTNFTNPLSAHNVSVDINNDGTQDYAVAVAMPTCAKAAIFTAALPSDVELGSSMTAGGTWYTDWDILATVTDTATGASVKVRQGVTVVLSQAQKTVACP
jgi:Tfp pilus assembly protein PilX